jgi:hypothetical protein
MVWARTLAACGASLALASCGLAMNGLDKADGGGGGDGAIADDGVAGDAGSSDGAGAQDSHPGADGPTFDAPQGGGASRCVTAGLLFCDGFEFGLGLWAPQLTGGGVAPDPTRAYRGSFSLHARVDPVSQAGSVQAAVQHFQMLPADVFVRVFVYQPSPFPPSSPALLDVLAGSSPYAGVQLRGQAPGVIAASAYNGPTDDWQSATPMPLDQWTCLEIESDGPSQTFRAWLDDVPLADMTLTFASPLPPLGILQVGLGYFTPNVPQAATDVWIDEVAVDGSRIGCAK